MSWASRRRTTYLFGVIVFFLVVVGGPIAYWYLTIPPTCTDGIQNHGETSIDKGGPCPILDASALQPESILWSRSFRVRDGSYNAVAYVQNPNPSAGVRYARYHFGLYDADNILVAERDGIMTIMPDAITPVLEYRIDTGHRIVARTYFEFTNTLTWERMKNTARVLLVSNKQISDTQKAPRLTADVTNTSVYPVVDTTFVAVVFDPAGNGFAASGATLERIEPSATVRMVFTWPDPFPVQVGRIDIIPIVSPLTLSGSTQ